MPISSKYRHRSGITGGGAGLVRKPFYSPFGAAADDASRASAVSPRAPNTPQGWELCSRRLVRRYRMTDMERACATWEQARLRRMRTGLAAQDGVGKSRAAIASIVVSARHMDSSHYLALH